MDTGSAIIGAILLAIFIVPIVILNYNRVRKDNKRLQSLKEFAQHHDCKISKHEFCGDFVIGLAESRNYVFFFKQTEEGIFSHFVDLSEIHTCKVIKNTRTIERKNEKADILVRVALNFLPVNKNKPEISFELYDERTNMQLGEELQLAFKWSNHINGLLKNKKQMRFSPAEQL